jgi:hypothetical protein
MPDSRFLSQNDLKNAEVATAADPALPVWCSAQAPEHFPNIRFKIAAPRLKGDKVVCNLLISS